MSSVSAPSHCDETLLQLASAGPSSLRSVYSREVQSDEVRFVYRMPRFSIYAVPTRVASGVSPLADDVRSGPHRSRVRHGAGMFDLLRLC